MGYVRVQGANVTGDIRETQFGDFVFVANPKGMNYELLPNSDFTDNIWDKIVELCNQAKEEGYNEVEPAFLARFLGLEVNEEEGWVSAPLPKPYNELELGVPPED